MWSDWLVVCDCGFSLSALWCPLATPTILLGFLLPWMWGISSQLLQQSTAAAPYVGRGVSPHDLPSWPWTWSSSSGPSGTHAATTHLQNARSIYYSKINQYNNHINSLKRKNFIINLNSYRKIFCQNSKTLSKVMIEGKSLNLLKNIQYVNKFGKLSSGLRTGKVQFSFQSQRRAMPKNVQTAIQLHSFHFLAKMVKILQARLQQYMNQ